MNSIRRFVSAFSLFVPRFAGQTRDTRRISRTVFGLAMLAVFLVAVEAKAEKGDLLKTFPFGVSKFALHPTQPILYATVPSTNGVAVIDIDALSLIDNKFIGSNPRGLAVSPDGSRVFVANSGSTVDGIGVLDTRTLTRTTLPTSRSASDVEVGLDGRLYVLASSYYGGNMIIDSTTGKHLGNFGGGSGSLEISPDRKMLYHGNAGLSPSSLSKFDISNLTAQRLQKASPGSNGQDLALSHDGQFLSYAVGGGNGSGYTIFKIPSDNIGARLGEFNTGAYPREITFSPDDQVAYAVHTRGEIDLFDTTTFLPLGPISTSGEAGELIVDRSGRYLFAAFGSELRVYDTGREVVPEPSTLVLLGMGLVGLLAFARRRRK